MRSRLVIEMELDAGQDTVVWDVVSVLMNYAGSDTGFSIRREILREKLPGELQVPDIFRGRKDVAKDG